MPALQAIEDICNLALMMVGSRAPINSIDEASIEAQQCKIALKVIVEPMLERFEWSFLSRQEPLALTTETRRDWKYCYAHPLNALRIWRVVGKWPPPRHSLEEPPFDRVLSADQSSMLIVSNEAEAVVQFSANLSTPLFWSASFSNAVAVALAAHLAMSLPVKPTLGDSLARMSRMKLLEAAAQDANHRQQHQRISGYDLVR